MHSTSAATRERKVRTACQRCRERRIKCDGRAPSCSKCEKAGVQCIDVSTVTSVGTVPRSLLSDALARVTWLEDVIKTRLPDVDLVGEPSHVTAGSDVGVATLSSATSVPRLSGKRRADEAGLDSTESPLHHGSRMATDLGLISLNVTKSRTHYLGASSGHFFADLLQDDSARLVDEDQSAESSDRDEPSRSDDGKINAQARAFAVLKQLRATLPKKEECTRLVRFFFQQYHPDYPVLHQPSIYSLIAAIYNSLDVSSSDDIGSSGFSKDTDVFDYNGQTSNPGSSIPVTMTTGSAQLLYILAISAHVQNHKHRFGSDPGPYEDLAIRMMTRTLGDVSLESVQLIVLSVLHGFVSGKSGHPWIFLHLGMSYAVDIGLHRSSRDSSRFSNEAMQMRRRVFFCLYELDRFISSVQGRPLGFQDDTLELILPTRVDSADDATTMNDQAFMDYSIARFGWAKLISEIKYHFYRFSSSAMSTSVLNETQVNIHTRLDEWVNATARQLGAMTDRIRPTLMTKLQINYEYAVCLLYQPSLSCRNPESVALRRCFNSAKQRLNLYWWLHEHDALILSWPVTHAIFLAGSTLVFCIWASSDVRSSDEASQTTKDLRLCTNLLTLGSVWWASARRCCRSFQSLVDKTTDAFLFPTTSSSTAVADPQITPTSMNGFEPLGVDGDLENPMDIEEMLRSFMQNDYHFSDVFDNFQMDYSNPYDTTWDFDLYSTQP